MMNSNYFLIGTIFYCICILAHASLCISLVYKSCQLVGPYLKGKTDLRPVFFIQFTVFYVITAIEIFYYLYCGYENDLFAVSLKVYPIATTVCYIQCKFARASFFHMSRFQKYLVNLVVFISYWACIISSGYYVATRSNMYEAETYFERLSSIVSTVSGNCFSKEIRPVLCILPLVLIVAAFAIDFKEKRSTKVKVFTSLMALSIIIDSYFMLQDFTRISVMSRTLEIVMIFIAFNIPAVCFLTEAYGILYNTKFSPEEAMVKNIYKTMKNKNISENTKNSQKAIAKRIVENNSDIYFKIRNEKLRNFLKNLVDEDDY